MLDVMWYVVRCHIKFHIINHYQTQFVIYLGHQASFIHATVSTL